MNYRSNLGQTQSHCSCHLHILGAWYAFICHDDLVLPVFLKWRMLKENLNSKWQNVRGSSCCLCIRNFVEVFYIRRREEVSVNKIWKQWQCNECINTIYETLNVFSFIGMGIEQCHIIWTSIKYSLFLYCLSLNLKCCDCLQRLKFTRHFFFQSIYGNTRTIQGNKFIF